MRRRDASLERPLKRGFSNGLTLQPLTRVKRRWPSPYNGVVGRMFNPSERRLQSAF